MRTKEDIQKGISEVLKGLRTRLGYSKTRMADVMGVDKHTWIRWETGANSPTIADFILLYEKLGEPSIRPLLDMIYAESGSEDMAVRKDLAVHFLTIANSHHVNSCSFMLHGQHGSDIEAQVEEFCAINHLPIQYRYFVAEQVYVYYMLARQRGELILTDWSMPDMEAFTLGLKSIQKAAFDSLKSTTGGNNGKL